MRGVPYWGKETFKEIKELRGQKAEKDKKDYKSLEEVFKAMVERNVVVEIDGYYAYARDIRFNYRDRLIVLPYWVYEESIELYSVREKRHIEKISESEVNIRYNYHMRLHLIENLTTGYRVGKLTYYDYKRKEKKEIDIEGLRWTSRRSIDLEELSRKYDEASYYFSGAWDFSEDNRYHLIDSLQGYNTEYRVRQQKLLPHYYQGKIDYSKLSYRDYLIKEYGDHRAYLERNGSGRSYKERKIDFELYLYMVMAEGLEPEERKEEYKELGKTRREFRVEGKENPFYIKHNYKAETKMRRKSYERYRKLTAEEEKAMLSENRRGIKKMVK